MQVNPTDPRSARMLQLQATMAFNALMVFAYKNVEIAAPRERCASCQGRHSMSFPVKCRKHEVEIAFCTSCGWRGSRPLSL